MFGVAPDTEPEKIVKKLLGEVGYLIAPAPISFFLLQVVDESVEAAEKWRKRSGVILQPNARPVKKHFSIFDEIPEELIEKRRSKRTVLPSLQVTRYIL